MVGGWMRVVVVLVVEKREADAVLRDQLADWLDGERVEGKEKRQAGRQAGDAGRDGCGMSEQVTEWMGMDGWMDG